MGSRFAAAAVLVLIVGSSPALATEAGFVDDDGIPGERNIEQLADLGVVRACDPPANTRFCPGDPATPAETVTVLTAAGGVQGTVPSLPLQPAVLALAKLLAQEGLIGVCVSPGDDGDCTEVGVSKAMLTKAIVYILELDAPGWFESPWDESAGNSPEEQVRVAAYHRLFDATAPRFDGESLVTRGELAEWVARAIDRDVCRRDPFTAERVASLTERHPGQSFTAYAYDTRTGCAYWMNPSERLRTASVFKVMVMAGALLEAQGEGREVTESEWEGLVPMITESANWPVRALWRRYGAAPWFGEQAEIFGLDETDEVGDYRRGWGLTRTSAKDQAELLRQVLVGEQGLLDDEYRQLARQLMTSVVESQTWGITEGVPDGWTVAQKNGFAGDVANSVGYVEEPDGEGGYVIAVLSNGWPGWRSGVDTVEEIAGWVSAALTRDSAMGEGLDP